MDFDVCGRGRNRRLMIGMRKWKQEFVKTVYEDGQRVTGTLKQAQKNEGPQALTVRGFEGGRMRSGGESRKTGVLQWLG